MEKYIIKHKIKGYTGKEACIVFSDGVSGIYDPWIASWFERKGYKVEKEAEGKSEAETIDYSKMKVEELKEIAKEKGIEGHSELKKAELIEKLG